MRHAATTASTTASSTTTSTSILTESIRAMSVNSNNKANNNSSNNATPCDLFMKNLLGVWRGMGSAFFPTMKATPFYTTEVRYEQPAGPTVAKFIHTSTSSHHAEKGIGMHFDDGFMRCTNGDRLSWMLAHNSNNVEALSGTVAADGRSVTLVSDMIGGEPETIKTKRVISFPASGNEVTGFPNSMEQLFYMQTKSVPQDLTLHLQATFARVGQQQQQQK